VLKRAYFMTVIALDGCGCYKQTRDTFQPSRWTEVRVRAVITLQTLR